MIFLVYIQNVTTIGPLVSETTCPISHPTDRQTYKQTNIRKRETTSSRKYESGKSAEGLDYYTSLAYAQEVKRDARCLHQLPAHNQAGTL